MFLYETPLGRRCVCGMGVCVCVSVWYGCAWCVVSVYVVCVFLSVSVCMCLCVCVWVCVCFQQVPHSGGGEVSRDGGSPYSEEKETGWKGGLTAEHRRRDPQAGAGRNGRARGVTDTRNPREGKAATTAREMQAGGHCQPHRHSLNTHRVDVEGPLSARRRVGS